MVAYGLFRYSFDGEEVMLFENPSEQLVAERALSVSFEGEGLVGYYSYRIEPIEHGKRLGQNMRYFQNGKEVTQLYKDLLMKSISSN